MNNKSKETDIKNCTCYYFDEKSNIKDPNYDILFNEKSYGNILI